MNEKIWISTDKVVDKYAYSIPKDTPVVFKGDLPVGVLDRGIKLYSPPRDGMASFREATPEELQTIQAALDAKAFTDRVNIMDTSQYTIGSDPELFAVNKDGVVIPAWKFLGSKTSSSIYWDGFQGEFTTTAHGCIAYWVDNFHYQLKRFNSYLHAYDPLARLVGDCVLPIPPEMMAETTPEQHQLGCMPSMNAYGAAGEGVEHGKALPIRFAGCHIHIGTQALSPEEFVRAVKFADALAGVISVSVLQGLEDPMRRRFYGLAGEYRLPSHGLEYRVLSSAITWHPALVHFFSNLVRIAVGAARAGAEGLWKVSEEEVQHTVNTLDIHQAQEIILRNRGVLEDILGKLYGTNQPTLGGSEYIPWGVPSPQRIVDEFILQGVKKYIPLDIEQNWLLKGGWVAHSEGPQVMMWRALKTWLDGWEYVPPGSR